MGWDGGCPWVREGPGWAAQSKTGTGASPPVSSAHGPLPQALLVWHIWCSDWRSRRRRSWRGRRRAAGGRAGHPLWSWKVGLKGAVVGAVVVGVVVVGGTVGKPEQPVQLGGWFLTHQALLVHAAQLEQRAKQSGL